MLPRYLRLHRRRCRYHSPVASFAVVVRLLAAFPIATSAARVTPIRLRCGLLLRSASATASSVAAAAAIPPASSVASPSLSSYDETKMKGELVCKKNERRSPSPLPPPPLHPSLPRDHLLRSRPPRQPGARIRQSSLSVPAAAVLVEPPSSAPSSSLVKTGGN